MPQKSPIYAITRIRVHEKDMIGRERMARMAESAPDEVMRLLSETGYGGVADPTLLDGDEMIARELANAYALINEVTFAPEKTDLFLLRGDIHNLKLLLKLRLTGSKDSPALMQGIYSSESVAAMVNNADYRELPEELSRRLNALEQGFAAGVDPAAISTELDRGYIEHCLSSAKGASLEYFRGLADFTNLLALLRIKKAGGSAERLRAALLPEGYIPERQLLHALDAQQEDALSKLAAGPARQRQLKGLNGFAETGRLTELERQRDGYLLSLFSGGRAADSGIEPLIGYLLGREQEAKNLRIIITAKRNGLPAAAITERLGELYG